MYVWFCSRRLTKRFLWHFRGERAFQGSRSHLLWRPHRKPVFLVESNCDEWGGAESRGNGARPVEWMIMNDTCATHRSRVPRRSSGRNKRRSDNSGRRERTRPGFYFMFCVRQSSARGCRFSVMFGYFVSKVFKCSPVPASFFPYISTSLHWCRSPGGRRDTLSESPRCWVGSRCWEDRAAGSGGDRQWLPEAVVLEQKKNKWGGAPPGEGGGGE